jgi:hypothetical protein
MRDLASGLSLAVLLASATYAADNTPVALDISGSEGVVIALEIGVGGITFTGSNKIEFKLTHSDDGVTYSDVDQDDVRGVTVAAGGIIKSLIAAHAAADVTKIGYHGGKKYLKLLADFSGTHGSGTPISALVIKGFSRYSPAE